MNDHYLLVDNEGKVTEVFVEIKIGRAETNDIILSDPLTSRHHATVYLEDDALMLRDEQSVNGTLVNGKQIYEPVSLNDQDQLKFGDEVLIVRSPLDQSKTIKSSSIPKEDEFSTVLKNPDEEFDKTVLADEEIDGEEKISSENVGSDTGQEQEIIGLVKKDNRLNIVIIMLVLIVLCVCSIAVVLILYFVLRESAILFNPNSIPVDSLSGFVF